MTALKFTAVAIALLALPFGEAFAEQILSECAYYSTPQTHVHVVTIDLHCRSVKLVGTPEGQGVLTTTAFAQKTNVDVAINGNFFGDGDRPYGVIVTDGKPWTKAKDSKYHAYIACDQANHCDIESVNSISRADPRWTTALAGSQIFENGNFQCASSAPPGCRINNADKAHPRTAIGLDAEGQHAYLVVVEGRLKNYPGMTLDQLSDVFRRLNVSRGVNMDGGGSSAMVIHGKRVNRLPDNQPEERAVVNHLGLRLQ